MMEAETDRFITVVAVEAAEEYVTVLSVGGGEQEGEDVLVYRLPGERLGFGLKFEGGTATGERVRRLFIQSCAPDSPASRAACSWGSLQEGDEVLQIDSVPVHMMTRLDCVRCLKDSNVVLKLRVRHAPPPPVPPRRCKDRPPEPEVYLDLLAQEAAACLTESESDDTGSSISTVVIDVAKVLSPFEQLERELEDESAPPLQPPLNFQDAPLSYGDEKVLPPKPAPRRDAAFKSGKKRPPPPPPPRSDRPQCPINVQSIAVAEANLGDLPRLVDVVPKSEYDGEVRPAIAEGRECILLGEEIPYFRKDMMEYRESTSELIDLQEHSVDSIFETIELEPEPMENKSLNTDYRSTTIKDSPKMTTKTISTEGDINESKSVDKQNNKPMTTKNMEVEQNIPENDSPKEIEELMIEVLTTVECETLMSDQTDGDSVLMKHIGFNSTMPETNKPLKVGNDEKSVKEADHCHSLIIENNNVDTALGNNENQPGISGNEDDIMIEKEEKLLKLSDEECQIEPEVFGNKEIIYKCLRNGAIKPNILEKDEKRHIILEHKAEASEKEENVTVKDGLHIKSRIFVNEQENILENTDNFNKQSEIITEIIGQDKNQYNLTNDRPQPTENGENRPLVMASKEIKSTISEENTSTKINHKTSEKDIILTSPLGMKPELSETEGRKDDIIYEKETLFKISEVERNKLDVIRNKGTKLKPTASEQAFGDNKLRDSDNEEKKDGSMKSREIKSKLPVPEHEKAFISFGKRDSKSKATEVENKPIIIGSVEIGSKMKEQTFIEKAKIKTTEIEENRHLEIENNKIRSKIPISKFERSKALVIENSDISETTKGSEEIRTKMNEIKKNKPKVTEENEIKHKLTTENNPVETEILGITSNFSTLEITESVPETKINGGEEKGFIGGKGTKSKMSDLEINRPEVIGCIETISEVLENKPEVTEPKVDRPSGADKAESKSAEETKCAQVTSSDSTPVLSANDSDSDEDFVLELPEWGGGSVFQPGIGMRCWGLATIGEDEEDSDNSNMLPGLSIVSEEDEDLNQDCVSVAEHSEIEATNNGAGEGMTFREQVPGFLQSLDKCESRCHKSNS